VNAVKLNIRTKAIVIAVLFLDISSFFSFYLMNCLSIEYLI
jgi:hypothetical protein